MKKRVIRVGSRESQLAVLQSRLVMELIGRAHPEVELELVTMKTTGDKILDRSLDAIGGKGLFVRELDQALRTGRVDITVHSLKDLPMETPEDLPLLAFSRREDPRDALILKPGQQELAPDALVGCGSRRRTLQLQRLYPELRFTGMRGNVQTRLRKLEEGQADATLLACAGLRRLGMEDRIAWAFSPEEMIPAAGQGILAVQGRAGEDDSFLDCVRDADGTLAAMAERAMVRALDGGCTSPIAAYAERSGSVLYLRGFYVSDSGRTATGLLEGSVEEPEELGIQLAEQLKKEAEG
ncbi:MAG: hydroxymethylbilane synthase [Eubacteriales bacterium]|jgi:hydroxymethylbilane synthase